MGGEADRWIEGRVGVGAEEGMDRQRDRQDWWRDRGAGRRNRWMEYSTPGGRVDLNSQTWVKSRGRVTAGIGKGG